MKSILSSFSRKIFGDNCFFLPAQTHFLHFPTFIPTSEYTCSMPLLLPKLSLYWEYSLFLSLSEKSLLIFQDHIVLFITSVKLFLAMTLYLRGRLVHAWSPAALRSCSLISPFTELQCLLACLCPCMTLWDPGARSHITSFSWTLRIKCHCQPTVGTQRISDGLNDSMNIITI